MGRPGGRTCNHDYLDLRRYEMSRRASRSHKAFASPAAAEDGFRENDAEGVAFAT
jgi:hypothetical protein